MNTIVTSPITHLCPHVDEVDHGTITLHFAGSAPELHEVRRFLDSYAAVKITHEELTEQIAEAYGCAVSTRWRTAGLDVEVLA